MRKIKLDIQLFAGGTIPGTDTAKYCIMQVVWSATASDAVANKSSVTASVQVRKTNSVSSTGTFNGSVTINGTTTNISKKFSPLGSSWKTVGSATIDVPHNSDGSKVCNIQAYLKQTGTTDMGGTYTADEDVTLDRILRGSVLDTFTSTNTAASYGFTKYVAGFYDVITFTSNGKTLATAYNPASAAGEYHYGINYDLSQVLAAATTAGNRTITVTATLRTYTDSSTTTQVGDAVAKTYNITLGSDTLNNISSLSVSNAGVATFIPSFSKWASGTYDNIIVTGSNFSQTIYGVSSGSTYTLNNTNLFNAMGTNTSMSLQFDLVSYSSSSGAYLGESTRTHTISLPAYNMTASVNSFIDQTTTPSGMSDDISTFKKTTNTMIRYLSNPLITYKVGTSTGYLYGRTISTSGARVVTGLVHNSTFTVEPGTNMSATYTINATDGRKPAATATQSFIVVPYFTPTLSVRFERTAPTASTATATITATYYNDTGDLLKNKKTLSTINTAILTYTEAGSTAVVKSYSDTTPTSSTSGNATTLTFTYNITGLDYQKSLAVSAQFKDLIGYTVISNATIPNGLPAINVFRYNDKNYAKVNGELIVDNNQLLIQEGQLNVVKGGIYNVLENSYGFAHYNTNGSNGHWFNTDVKVQGNVYGGTGYDRQLAFKDETLPLVNYTGNFNNYTESSYGPVNGILTNKPTSGSNYFYGTMLVLKHANNYIEQIAFNANTGLGYSRYMLNGTWKDWVGLNHTRKITFANEWYQALGAYGANWALFIPFSSPYGTRPTLSLTSCQYFGTAGWKNCTANVGYQNETTCRIDFSGITASETQNAVVLVRMVGTLTL